MDPIVWVVLPVAAFAASTISGFMGMGGGITLIGVMSIVLPAAPVVPIHGLVQLASNLTRTLVFFKHVRWKVFAIYAVPVALGMAGAAMVWSGDKLAYFKPGIGVFILAFLYWRRHKPTLRNLPLWTYAPLGLVSGFIAIFVGATGPFIAPFFLRDDFKKEQVIATKAVCQAWGHLMKIPAFLLLDFDYLAHVGLIGALVVCVILGTLTGKWILGKMSPKAFVLAYEIVLGSIALLLIITGTAAIL